VLSSMRMKRMRMTPPSVILAKGYMGGLLGCDLGQCWAVVLGYTIGCSAR
jgi:hypothetical protein